MNELQTLTGAAEGFDFMFYESYKDTINRIRKLYSEEEAGTFCMELVRYGVRRERKETMRPELEAVIRSIYPLIDKSKEHKDETAEAMKNRSKN